MTTESRADCMRCCCKAGRTKEKSGGSPERCPFFGTSHFRHQQMVSGAEWGGRTFGMCRTFGPR
jgi:hypothetical protein